MQVFISASRVSDGSMKPAFNDVQIVQNNRTLFLAKNDIAPENTTLLRLEYGGDDYCRYLSLDESNQGNGITRESTVDVDALVVTRPHHALLLPLADCIGAVLHDPTTNTLMLSHLGRHNIEQMGGTKSVEYLASRYKVNPADLHVWLSPAAGKDAYPLHAFNNKGLHEVAIEQLLAAGVPRTNIDTSPIDTTKDRDYFSHSEFLKGNRPTDGRFCVIAVMR